MTQADVWFDPLCPWAWMTTRWMTEVEAGGVPVRWRLMSLAVLNEHADGEESRARAARAWAPVRVVAAAGAACGDAVVKPLYDAIGTRLHPGGRTDLGAVLAEALAEVGLPAELAQAADVDTHDEEVRASHAEAVALVGQDVGTPVVAIDGVAYFGPVVTPAPTGDDAIRLWEGLVAITQVPGLYELKRHRSAAPSF